MHEAEPRRVQRETSQRIPTTPVRVVAGDRMAGGGELRPDLTAPSRRQGELDERRVSPPLENAVARDRRPSRSAVVRRVDAQRPILNEARGQHPLRPPHHAFHERDVDTLDVASRKPPLQTLLGGDGLGEDDQPRGLAIEAVNDEKPGAGGTARS